MRRTRAMGATRRTPVLIVLVLGFSLAASACSLIGAEQSGAQDRVVLVTHDAFALPPELQQRFETESGYQLVVRTAGDGGALTNKLVLTAGDPIGDVAYGVDNTFASRALDADVFARYAAPLPAGAEDYLLPGDDERRLTPVDSGNVCVNIDTTWFTKRSLDPPRTLDDLIDPAYRDLLVLPGATTSSTGLAFLLATIAAYGEEWPDYWSQLMRNGATVTAGWSDAYEVDFTQGGGTGTRPIVVSYDSSPAFTVPEGATASSTQALLATCFQQVEYAGVLQGAANPEGARALVDFLLSDDVQASLPESMYVFPVADSVALPAAWAQYVARPRNPYTLDPAEITAHRDEWLREWSDITSR